MSRASFISSCGDPFILSLSYKLFKERYYDELDTFYVDINNHCKIPKDVIAELVSKLVLDPKVNLIYHPTGLGNGVPLTEMTLVSREDNIVLLEDDCFPFTPGVIDGHFNLIETGAFDAVGSPRFSCGAEVAEAAKSLYGLDYSGYGDRGPSFWPAFMYCKRADLLRTDLNFASYEYKEGEYYNEIYHTMSETQYADTFVHASLQLRELGLNFAEIPQHKADPYEAQSKEKKEMNWHESQQPFSYIHGGSLSAGWGGYLTGSIPDVSNESAMLEMETRCAFWQICSDVAEGFTDFKKQYQQGIKDLVKNAGLDQGRIDQKILIYRSLMNV